MSDEKPLLDRNAVRWAIADELDGEGVVSYGLAPKLTDRVMELARPMPTREEIHALIDYEEAEPFRDNLTDNILALLNGAES